MEKNPYEVLDVHERCTQDEIKTAYRNLIKKYHPDIPETGDKEKFDEVQEAYKILGSPQSRRLYDDTGFVDLDENKITQAIAVTLRSLMTMFLSRGEEIFTTDIIKESLDYCKAKIQENAVHAAELRQKKKYLTRVVKKFKRKKSSRHDFIRDIVVSEQNAIDQEINKRLHAITVLENTKLVISDYEFDFMKTITTTQDFKIPGRVSLGNIFDLAKDHSE
jgi:curved DNA-binding protein CbpA